ncbi:hypothetical protein LIER_43625 [Lithospermum erythrorhizon]|uniref:Uncharacterized protein n=1 Tax=Lithospermum erythrorhizon TaxID=34254 RepID=A0AAV3QJ04_LITER
MVVSSSSEEDNVTGPLLRMYLPFPRLSFIVDPFFVSILNWVVHFRAKLPTREPPVMGLSDADLEPRGFKDGTSQGSRGYLSTSPVLYSGQGKGSLPPTDLVPASTPFLAGEHSATVVLEPEDHEEIGSATPQAVSLSPLLVLVLQAARLSPSLSEGIPSSRNRVRSPPANPRPVHSQRRSDKVPFLRIPWRRRGPEQREGPGGRGPAAPPQKSGWGTQHPTGERYAASVRRTEAVRAQLEGVQAERDSAQLERASLMKERESLRASRDEKLQSNDCMLG